MQWSKKDNKSLPHQTRWVFDKWISADEYDATPKSVKEGFQTLFSLKTSQVGAVVLLGALVAGIYISRASR